MNTTDLQQKVEDVVKLLGAALGEVDVVESKRKALEEAGLALSDRERKIYAREVGIQKREEEIAAQKQYIDEQAKTTQQVLTKITHEKESLQDLAEQKRLLDKERSELELEKKTFVSLQQEQEQVRKDRVLLEEERKLFAKEKLGMQESQQLFATREAALRAKEERFDKIERMTQV